MLEVDYDYVRSRPAAVEWFAIEELEQFRGTSAAKMPSAYDEEVPVTVAELIVWLNEYPPDLIVVVPTVVETEDGDLNVIGDAPALRLSPGEPDELILVSETEAKEMEAEMADVD